MRETIKEYKKEFAKGKNIIILENNYVVVNNYSSPKTKMNKSNLDKTHGEKSNINNTQNSQENENQKKKEEKKDCIIY